MENGEHAIRDKILLEKTLRFNDTKISEISHVFYSLIHHGFDEGFSNCLNKYWHSNLQYCYIQK